MSPTERQAVWPQIAAVLGAEWDTTIAFLREFTEIFDTVPEEHKSDFVAILSEMATLFNRAATTTPGSSVQAKKAVVKLPACQSTMVDTNTDNLKNSLVKLMRNLTNEGLAPYQACEFVKRGTLLGIWRKHG